MQNLSNTQKFSFLIQNPKNGRELTTNVQPSALQVSTSSAACPHIFTSEKKNAYSLRKLRAMIIKENRYSFDHWTLNGDIFFGDFGGTYVAARHHAYLYNRPELSPRGFVEVPDCRLSDLLRREWEAIGYLEFTNGSYTLTVSDILP